jgi:hypothetical protein
VYRRAKDRLEKIDAKLVATANAEAIYITSATYTKHQFSTCSIDSEPLRNLGYELRPLVDESVCSWNPTYRTAQLHHVSSVHYRHMMGIIFFKPEANSMLLARFDYDFPRNLPGIHLFPMPCEAGSEQWSRIKCEDLLGYYRQG